MLPFFAYSFQFQSFGQRTVTGNVSDASEGFSLIGVNVVVKGTTTGTATDINGDYSIDVPSDNSILTFSYVGYETMDVPVEWSFSHQCWNDR